jgi:ABC-type uncharacterized transport system ATPase subunit
MSQSLPFGTVPTMRDSQPVPEQPSAREQGPGSPVLVATDIVVDFDEAKILKGASLTVEEGEIHVVIGPNGAGKTTLANVLTGHIRPTSGRVELRGEPLTGVAWRRARRGVGRKFQVPRVFTRLSARENLAVAAAGQRKGGETRLGDDIGVEDILDTRAELLSHGWRQRLEMKMVLEQGPAVAVLDEPTAGIPRSERAELARIIKQQRAQVTYLIVEHDMEFVEAVADRVSFMHDGRVVASGTFAEIRRHPTVREIYLGEAVTASPDREARDAAGSDGVD